MNNLPEQFVNRMRKMLGEEELHAFLSSYDRPMARGLRINPLKLPERMSVDLNTEAVRQEESRHPVLTELVEHYGLRPIPWAAPCGFYYGESPDTGSAAQSAAEESTGRSDDVLHPGRSPLHEVGLFYIQEPSAMAAAALAELVSDAAKGAEDFGSPTPFGTETNAIPADLDSFLQEDLRRLMRTEESCQGEKVLDLCAAPGGKTTMLAAAMRGRGLLVANEIDAGRAKILSQNVERMGITNALVVNESPEKLSERFPAFFDRVLVDAPCSGEGMFRRQEQALSMWSEENIALCAARQAQILDCAAGMVKSGGFLIYSTCTFAPEENEGSIAAFLARHPEFSVVDVPALLGEDTMRAWGFEAGRPEWAGMKTPSTGLAAGEDREDADGAEGLSPSGDPGGGGSRPVSGAADGGAGKSAAGLAGTIRLWPHRLKGEGHFVAVLQKEGMRIPEEVPQGAGMSKAPAGAKTRRRKSAARPRAAEQEQGRSTDAQTKLFFSLLSFFLEDVTVDLPGRLARESGSGLVRFGDALWLVPYRDEISLEGLRVLRPGLQLGTVKRNRFEPSHAFAMALRPGEAARVLDLAADAPEAAAFLRGESLPCDAALKGWTLVAIGGISAGWGKASGGVLKNHYPKGLRRPY